MVEEAIVIIGVWKKMKNKLSGLKIGSYEIVDKIDSSDVDHDYEKVTLKELLNKVKMSKTEKMNFLNENFAVNIHVMLSKETLGWAWETMRDRVRDKRLADLNAVVFLSLKPKGRGSKYHAVSQKEFKKLVDFALKNRIDIGFDSCSAAKFLKSVKGRRDFKRFQMFTEPCESGIFSSYVNVEGKYFPCSFCEGQDGIRGIDLTKKVDFFKNLWYSDSVKSWRKKLLGNVDKKAGCRSCPVFKV